MELCTCKMALNILRSVRVVLAQFYVQRCACSEAKRSIRDGPALEHFIKGSVSPCDQPEAIEREDIVPYLSPEDLKAKGRKGKDSLILMTKISRAVCSPYAHL